MILIQEMSQCLHTMPPGFSGFLVLPSPYNDYFLDFQSFRGAFC